MITPERITAWLTQPHQLHEIASNVLQQLAKDFPYFSVAQYLLYLSNQGNSSFAEVQVAYPVNKVLLSKLIKLKENPPIVEDIGVEIQEEVININETEQILVEPQPLGDYFSQQGIEVPNELPEMSSFVAAKREDNDGVEDISDEDKALMVVMSFSEWISHISKRNAKAREEAEEQKALKSMWQQQKLASLLNEEDDEIPEQVFEMAVNSITRDEDPVNETFANIYMKQGKLDKAIDIYKKLSLIYPEKSVYFAAKIENLQKEL